MATLTWLGHASFRLDTDDGKRIYVDPFLDGPTIPEDEKDPERADVIAVTHGHGDHVGDVARFAAEDRARRSRHGRADGLVLGRTARTEDELLGVQQGRHASRSTASRFTHRQRVPFELERRRRRRTPASPCGVVIRFDDHVASTSRATRASSATCS